MAKRSPSKKVTRTPKRAFKQHVAGYDDPSYDFRTYWRDRAYEHAAEALAIEKLLGARHFKRALDVGGGYGRLSKLLLDHADHVVLAEPSRQQLTYAADFLKHTPGVELKQMQADNLTVDDESVDLVLMVRVLSHIAYPGAEFAEIARVLSDDGVAIIEVANYIHIVNRMKYLFRGKHLPSKAVALTPTGVIRTSEFQLMSHNPHTVARQLAHAGLKVERVLSVSNLRSPRLKRYVPVRALITMERLLQRPLAGFDFGPSMFFLVKKSRS